MYKLHYPLSRIIRQMLRALHFLDFLDVAALIRVPVLFQELPVKLQKAYMHGRLAIVDALFKVIL